MGEKYHNDRVDKPFLSHIIRDSYVTAPAIGVVLYLIRKHLPVGFAEGFTYGAFCGITNLYLLSILIRSTVKAGKTRWSLLILSGTGLNAVLFAYLYVIWRNYFNNLAMVIGFSYVLGMIVLEALLPRRKKGPEE